MASSLYVFVCCCSVLLRLLEAVALRLRRERERIVCPALGSL